MRTNHLSETEIQNYVLGMSDSTRDERAHVERCKSCTQNIQLYSAVFEGIAQQAYPAFEFNVQDLVMTQLVPVKKKPVSLHLFAYGIGMIVMIIVGSVIFLFGSELISLPGSATSIGIHLVEATLGSVFLFLAYDVYRRFTRGMKELVLR